MRSLPHRGVCAIPPRVYVCNPSIAATRDASRVSTRYPLVRAQSYRCWVGFSRRARATRHSGLRCRQFALRAFPTVAVDVTHLSEKLMGCVAKEGSKRPHKRQRDIKYSQLRTFTPGFMLTAIASSRHLKFIKVLLECFRVRFLRRICLNFNAPSFKSHVLHVHSGSYE